MKGKHLIDLAEFPLSSPAGLIPLHFGDIPVQSLLFALGQDLLPIFEGRRGSLSALQSSQDLLGEVLTKSRLHQAEGQQPGMPDQVVNLFVALGFEGVAA